MASLPFFLCTLLTFSLTIHQISAVKYVVRVEGPPTHVGIQNFNKIIGGIPYTTKIMGEINAFIWSTVLKQNTAAERKPVDTVQVFIRPNVPGLGVTWGTGDKINISADYLQTYPGPKPLQWEFTSLLYHEMTHVFQWDGENKAPTALTEGIADYTILKANYFPPAFMKPGSGVKWDQGYDYTARFLEYCDGLVPGFVAKINNMIKKTYDVSFFKTITGKPVEQLWKDYKAKYPGVK